jgi:hypothetical protein
VNGYKFLSGNKSRRSLISHCPSLVSSNAKRSEAFHRDPCFSLALFGSDQGATER